MSIVANIRVNALVPFPSLVMGTGPITIGKANGIWTVGFNTLAFGAIVPPVVDFPFDFLLGQNANTGAFFRVSLTTLLAAVAGAARAQRSVTASPIVVVAADQILNLNINAGAPTCALPAAATRAGVPLTFVDVGKQAGAHNITLTPNGAETIMNAPNPAAYVMAISGQSITLYPFNDGVNSGWFIT